MFKLPEGQYVVRRSAIMDVFGGFRFYSPIETKGLFHAPAAEFYN